MNFITQHLYAMSRGIEDSILLKGRKPTRFEILNELCERAGRDSSRIGGFSVYPYRSSFDLISSYLEGATARGEIKTVGE